MENAPPNTVVVLSFGPCWYLPSHLSLHLYTWNLKPEAWKGLWSKHLHYTDQTNPCSERLSNLHKVTQPDWRENLGRLGVSFLYSLRAAWITCYTLLYYNREHVVRWASQLFRLQMTWMLCDRISVGEWYAELGTWINPFLKALSLGWTLSHPGCISFPMFGLLGKFLFSSTN